jgi:hypothetical protein
MSANNNRIREIVGVVLASLGVALIPIGWYLSRFLWVAAVVIALVGILLFMTKRVVAAEDELSRQSSAYAPPVKPSVPGDIHNYSGWRDGGRSLGGGDGAGDAGD